MRVSIGIEGTYEPVSGRDTLRATGHYRRSRLAADFQLVRRLGVDEVRYPIPWQRVEARRGVYDWSFVDRAMDAAAQAGVQVIADPLHHTSYPRWLRDGWADDAFPDRYLHYVEEIAQRYPYIKQYTPVNEPTCTLDFCGNRGFWHPYGRGERSYVRMLQQTARAAARVIRRLRAHDPQIYILQVDTFQHHAALDEASRARAEFLNHRRFLFDELILGRVGPSHPLFPYLLEHGFDQRQLEWHQGNPAPYDERGGNYYPLNEEQLADGKTHHAPSQAPRGLAALMGDYAERLMMPLSMTETNIQGTVRDRISWLKYMLEQCERAEAAGIPLRRFAWYPLFDCCGWNSLLQGKRWTRDPQGLFSCGRTWERQETELSRLYAEVAAGKPSAELPAYRFTARHDRTLAGLKPHDWDWVDQGEEARAQNR